MGIHLANTAHVLHITRRTRTVCPRTHSRPHATRARRFAGCPRRIRLREVSGVFPPVHVVVHADPHGHGTYQGRHKGIFGLACNFRQFRAFDNARRSGLVPRRLRRLTTARRLVTSCSTRWTRVPRGTSRGGAYGVSEFRARRRNRVARIARGAL